MCFCSYVFFFFSSRRRHTRLYRDWSSDVCSSDLYYAMAGQGFDPDFIFSWPTGRMGVMEGESAVPAVFGSQLEKLRAGGEEPDEALNAEMDRVKETYEKELDAKYAAARGFVDAVIAPEETRDALELALRVSLNYSGPHLGQFVLPAGLA